MASSPATALHRTLAQRLASFRRERGWTLEELAKRSGVSVALLSRAENMRSSVSLETLAQLAEALETTPADLIHAPDEARPIVIDRGTQAAGPLLREGLPALLLATAKQGKQMQPLIVSLPNGKDLLPPVRHEGEEFIHVLSGACELAYGGEIFQLETNDSAYFEATVPHSARATKPKTRLLSVVASRDYLFHSDLSKIFLSSSR